MSREVEFILDEAAMVGALDAVNVAVGIGRGYGVRLQLYYQSMGQLERCFPDGQKNTLLSNTSQVFFGVNDNATADYVSARLGEETIILESGGKSSGSSRQYSYGAHPSDGGGSSWNENQNWQQQARRLLKPEEVIALSPRDAITFTPGVPPVFTRLLRYYEEPDLGKPRPIDKDGRAEVRRFILATLWCAVVLSAAACVTLALHGIVAGQLLLQP